jgi:hypothetical protein
MYNIKPDRVGWTVYDIESGRPLLLDDIVLTGLDHEAADELAGLLNRSLLSPLPADAFLPRGALDHHLGRDRQPV